MTQCSQPVDKKVGKTGCVMASRTIGLGPVSLPLTLPSRLRLAQGGTAPFLSGSSDFHPPSGIITLFMSACARHQRPHLN